MAPLTPAEVFGFITGAACVWLLVKQNIWTWPTGIANNILSIIVFHRAHLYGDMSLQFFFIAISIYGWWHWLHPDDRHRGEVKVGRTPWKAAMILFAVTALAIAIVMSGLRRLPGTVPFLDASTTCMSLTAQFMQSRKWIENWWVWIAVDVLSVGLYLYKGLALYALLYAVFMGMCIAGLFEWRGNLRAQQAAA